MKILFIDGTKGFTPSRLKDKPTGGILTSLSTIPVYLARHGHDLYVKSSWDGSGKIDGVTYLSFSQEISECDIVVFNRNVLSNGLLDQARATGAKFVWWLHDIVDHRYLVDDAFRKIPNIFSLSQYCTKTYSEFYGIAKDRFTIIPNGINPRLFYPGDYKRRNPNLFVFASAPIKGMKPLAYTFNNLKRHFPKAELRVYSNQALHGLKEDALVAFWKNELSREGATLYDPISQEELADVMREAWLLLMPNSYPEICSNLILQARACGLPIVTSPVGSIPEFVKDGVHGLVTRSYPHDLYFWGAEFARLAVTLCFDKPLHEKISLAAPRGVNTWDDIGNLWNKYLTWIHQSRDGQMKQEALIDG